MSLREGETCGPEYVSCDSLVLYSSLGKALNIPTPASDAIITLGGMLLKKDFIEEGTTIDKLGFNGLDVRGLIEAVS